jgi:hypothetical protein
MTMQNILIDLRHTIRKIVIYLYPLKSGKLNAVWKGSD